MIREYGQNVVESGERDIPDHIKHLLFDSYDEFVARNPLTSFPSNPKLRVIYAWYVAVEHGEPDPNVGE